MSVDQCEVPGAACVVLERPTGTVDDRPERSAIPRRSSSLGPRPRLSGHWQARLALVVLICGLVVRVVRLGMNSPLWGDEAMLVHSLLDRSYAQMFEPLDYIQIAPLGFLWGELTCFRLFGPAEWVWRLLPAIVGCVSLVVFARLARHVLPRHAAWFAAAIAAGSLYLVRHTVEAKPYIWDFAFAVALLWLGWRIHERPDKRLRWWAFGLLAALSVWCSFPSAFVAGGVLLSLIAVLTDCALAAGGPGARERGNRETHVASSASNVFAPGPPISHFPAPSALIRSAYLLPWLACGLLLSGSFLAMYFLFGRVQVQTANDAGYWQFSMWEVAFPPWHRPHQLLWWLVREHAGSMMAHPFGGKNFASTLTLLLVLNGAVVLARRNSRLLALLLAPAALGFLAACLQKYPYGGTARTMLYFAPSICLLAGLGLWAAIVRLVPPERRRTACAGALIACLGLIAVKLGLEIACPYKQYSDWLMRETVQRWAADAQPDDVWVIANAAATPDRTDGGLFGGTTVAVLDHYTQLHAADRAWYPRAIVDFPDTSGRVALLIHESQDWPLTAEIGETFRQHFSQQAQLVDTEIVPLPSRETLRKLVYVKRK